MSSEITLEKAIEALATVYDPDLKKDLISLKMARKVEILENNKVKFNLVLTTPACPLKEEIEDNCKQALKKAGAREVEIDITSETRSFRGIGNKIPIDGVKNIIAVSSGKGGVGKSTLSVNLAIALEQLGAKVGLLDADITGPNVPLMLGNKLQPSINEAKKILPLEAHGLKFISMGSLIEEERAVIWRGPMLHSAINQFFRDVAWGELDYLVIDLPPGTGDAQITICQSVPIAGAIVVSTPQEVAWLDSKKAINMFKQMKVEILGLIENMSYLENQGEKIYLFGKDGVLNAAKSLGLEFLAQIPLFQGIREGGDTGEPILTQLENPENKKIKNLFRQAAEKLVSKISINNHSVPE